MNMFNVTKDDPIINKKIFISGIQSAEILRFSYYDVPEELVRKLDDDSLAIGFIIDNSLHVRQPAKTFFKNRKLCWMPKEL